MNIDLMFFISGFLCGFGCFGFILGLISEFKKE